VKKDSKEMDAKDYDEEKKSMVQEVGDQPKV